MPTPRRATTLAGLPGRGLGVLGLSAALAALLSATGAFAWADRPLLALLTAAGVPGVVPPATLAPGASAAASAGLVLVPGLAAAALSLRLRHVLPVMLLVPVAAVLGLLRTSGVWLAPLPALMAAKVPFAVALWRQRQRARAELGREQDRARTVLETIDEAVLGLDPAGRIRFANPAAERLAGVPAGGLEGRDWAEALPLEDRATGRPIREVADLAAGGRRLARLGGGADGGDAREVRVAASGLPPSGDAAHLMTLTDVSEVSRLNASLIHSATHDGLTGLANRGLACEHLAYLLGREGRRGGVVAALLLDLDDFKHVNDALGHQAGDELLREVARRLVAACRPEDLVARLGGDEFLCVTEGSGDPGDTAALAARLLAAFDAPFAAAGQELLVTPSIGASLYPADARDPDGLLRAADVAMYAAKREGGVRFFTAELDAAARDQLRLRRALRHALARREFRLDYQLKVSLDGLAPVGFEALLRWRHDRLGAVPPGRFVPVAEGGGLIEPITRFVLGEACRQCRSWREGGMAFATVAVNVSARHLLRGDLAAEVEAALAASGLEPAALALELTEGTLMREPERAIAQLRRLKDLGVGIAVDDFGTGYSSLAYLRDLPLDTVKIDRAFVSELGGDGRPEAIVAAIVALARGLGLVTIAEGVETTAQAARLAELGCEQAQGFLFARPAPPDEVPAVLAGLDGMRGALG